MAACSRRTLAQAVVRVALLWVWLGAAMLSGACALLPSAGPPAREPGTGPKLVVVAPKELLPLLEKYLDLGRLQDLRGDETVDDIEWARLIGAAPAQARELLQTEGYFDAQVSAARTTVGAQRQVTLTVDPGPRTRVAGLQIDTEGDLRQRIDSGEAKALALKDTLASDAARQVGQAFRNPDWVDVKQGLLARLRAAGYASATMAHSQALVDVPSQRAQLSVMIASGPLYLAGPLQIEGLRHHDEATVRHLAGFGSGAPLTEALLLDYQERLQKAGLFESANISFEPVAERATSTPLRVRLTELPLQQATVGLGVSANTGQRATLEHSQRRLLGQAVTAHNKLEWARESQTWSGDFQTHPGEGFYRNLLGVQVDRVNSATDVVLSQRLRLGRTQDTPRIERLYFGELLRSRQSDIVAVNPLANASPNTATAVSANYHLVWRDLDSVLLPTRGLTLALQGGAGQASSQGGTSGPFARVYGRLTGYLPLGQAWYGQARLEAGQIFKSDKVTVPDALGFRAGGDDSVRGYAFRSLAPVGRDGGTVSGASLLTVSAELARPIMASLPALWGAVFIDAGRAVEHWHDDKLALGYGVGLRWRSPIGPLKVDLAWGDELHKLRLHFTVGIAF